MINKVFSAMVINVGNNVQDTSTAMQSIIKNYINDTYFDLLRRTNYNDINDSYSFLTDGSQDYVLPSDFGKELYAYDSTNKIRLSPIDLQQLVLDFQEGLNVSGQVQRYAIIKKQVRKQPTSSSVLSVASSSASDTTQIIRVKGIDSNNIELNESITLTGTTPVNSINSYIEIRSITKSSTSLGRITITSNSGGATVAILSPADLAYSVMAIRLHYIPSGTLTISLPYQRNPYPLVNDYDQPVINAADIIELGATQKSWMYKRQFSKAMEYKRLYEMGIMDLIWDIENQVGRPKSFHPLPYDRNSD